jgi:hypothetical protein
MNTGILVPAFLAAAAISVRAVVGSKRAPYPYELLSWGIVYGAAGMIGESEPSFGQAMAWGYLVATLVSPKYADIWKLIPTGSAVPQPKSGASGTATAQA